MDEALKRILIVDSNPAIHEDFHKIFSDQTPHYVIDSAYKSEQAIHCVQDAIKEQHPYTLIFIDLASDTDGISTIQHIWKIDPEVCFVLCNAYSTYSWQSLTEKLQRPDHFLLLNKPFDINEIRQLVLYISTDADKNTEIKEKFNALEEKIKYLYTHDILTGLGNVTSLKECIEHAIVKAEQRGTTVGIALLFVDHLSEIQTVFGCHIVDALLKSITEKLKANCTSAETLIRKSHNEFAIILSDQASDEALIQKIEKLSAEFLLPLEIDKHSFFVSMHSGVATTQDGKEAGSLLQKAETALSYSKILGKKKIQFYCANYHDAMLRRAELMISLPQALKKNQFVLHYQPLVKANSSQIIGVEALIRWQHPVFGLLYPQEFIPLAEETGAIASLGEWVLKTALTKVKKWQETLYAGLIISINISSYQFCQPNFEGLLQRLLKKTGLLPSHLELEVIAHPMLMETSDILQKMNRLKELGMRFSLDNFGRGFANLDYLQAFPFDKVKIDRSFVKHIQSNPKENIVIETIIYLAQKMGIQVVAEGVETQAQVEFLFNHHGEQMQGYYFSPPLSEDACATLLQKQGSIIKEEG